MIPDPGVPSGLRLVRLGLADPAWSAFVHASAPAVAFHHPAWAALLSATYRYEAFALALTEPGGAVRAGLPVVEVAQPLRGRRWVSLPFTDECPPLLAAGQALSPLLAELEAARAAAGVRRLEVRAPVGAGRGFAEPAGVVHRLALEADVDAVHRRFHKSQVQRNIRRAEREGVEVRQGESPADLVTTYYDLHLRTRRRQGVPAQPRRYFELLWDHVLSAGLGRVSLAYHGGTAVAGAVFLSWNGTEIYKYGASDDAAWSLRPNHLIFWDAIRRACEQGSHTFDFGRTEAANTGLREFKAGWGAREEPLAYASFSDRPRAPASELPGPVRGLLRRSPPWACRAVGTLLYRYAA